VTEPGQPDQDGRWFTRHEAADHARVSVSTIDRAIKSGELRASKRDGGLVRLRVRWVDAWLLGRGAQVILVGTAGSLVAMCLCHLGRPTHPAHVFALTVALFM